jgi:hypothetical protein
MNLKEYYHWQITLDDGRVIEQSNDGDKEEFKFDNRNPDLDNIRIFKLTPKEVNSHELSEVTIEIPEGAKLIYFKKTIANTGNVFPKFQLTLVGWQMNTSPDGKGKNIKYILYVYPDGKIIATSGDSPSVQEFVDSLPKKDASEIKGCTGCQPRLVKAKPDGKE